MKLKGIFLNSPAWKKFLLLIWFICISFIITYGLSLITAYAFWGNKVLDTAFLSDMSNPESIGVMKYLQAFNSIGMFLIPALLLSWIAFPDTRSYFGVNTKINPLKLLLVILLALSMLPISNMLAELNQSVSFPDSLSGLEDFLRRSEKEAEQLTHLFINASNMPVLFLNIFIIAVIPAIAEEFFFRGALQKLFAKLTKNTHTAIFITAFVFSIIHFQFFSFTPRFFLGIVFGYLMYYTGNIWVPVIAHFINNAAAIIVYYMITSNQLSPDAEHVGNSATLAWFAVGFVVSVFAFYAVCRKPRCPQIK